MKKALASIVVLMVCVSLGISAQFNWQTDAGFGSGLYGPGGSAPSLDWQVWLYKADGNTLPSMINADGSPNDGGSRLAASTSPSLINAGWGYVYETGYTDTGLGLAPNDYIYSVFFDSSDITAGFNNYVIVDDAPFMVPTAASGVFDYDMGSTASDGGDWQVIPEPSTFALFGLGMLSLLGVRRKK